MSTPPGLCWLLRAVWKISRWRLAQHYGLWLSWKWPAVTMVLILHLVRLLIAHQRVDIASIAPTHLPDWQQTCAIYRGQPRP